MVTLTKSPYCPQGCGHRKFLSGGSPDPSLPETRLAARFMATFKTPWGVSSNQPGAYHRFRSKFNALRTARDDAATMTQDREPNFCHSTRFASRLPRRRSVTSQSQLPIRCRAHDVTFVPHQDPAFSESRDRRRKFARPNGRTSRQFERSFLARRPRVRVAVAR